MTPHKFLLLPLAAAALLAACGGGSDSPATGTMRLSLTDAPACGYDRAFVTVEKVRVHQSSSAGEAEAGWSEVVLATPQRVDLLTLSNGVLLPLGQTELTAGTYTQLRLVLAANTTANPMANSITPTGGVETALTTPSGQTSGLKVNVNLVVAAGQVADFAIDFDACKSFVKAGNSGQYHLKPVLSVIPILYTAGQRIVGFVDPSLVSAGATVSVQSGGVSMRATAPDTSGRFTLYPVVTGSYDLVITANGRVNAVMTGVPVSATASTVIGSEAARINTAVSAQSAIASGLVTVSGSLLNTGAAVRATQSFTGGPVIEVAYSAANAITGAYSMVLPTGAPTRLGYAAGATTFAFTADASAAGRYRLESSAPSFAVRLADITLPPDVALNFNFVP